MLVVSERGGAVTTAPGVTLDTAPLTALDGEEIDTLIVPGGLARSGVFHLDGLVEWLAANGSRPRRLCSASVLASPTFVGATESERRLPSGCSRTQRISG